MPDRDRFSGASLDATLEPPDQPNPYVEVPVAQAGCPDLIRDLWQALEEIPDASDKQQAAETAMRKLYALAGMPYVFVPREIVDERARDIEVDIASARREESSLD